MADLSQTSGAVPLAVFLDMNKRFIEYNKAHDPDAAIVYIKSGGADYVTAKTFENMQYRYDQYKEKNGKPPAVVYFKAPTPTPTPVVTPSRKVGVLQARLESAVGEFNSFTGFYNKSKGRGYAYYYNDVKNLEQEIQAYINKTGLNCSDAAQLFTALAVEMGYQTRYVHVMCKSGGHIRMQIRGKEFPDWTRVDPAACISVGSQYPIGQVWCDYDNAHIETSNWILVDDGA